MEIPESFTGAEGQMAHGEDTRVAASQPGNLFNETYNCTCSTNLTIVHVVRILQLYILFESFTIVHVV
jgi:hypothetical protein